MYIHVCSRKDPVIYVGNMHIRIYIHVSYKVLDDSYWESLVVVVVVVVVVVFLQSQLLSL